MAPFLSVIICTRGRCKSLKRSLEYFSRIQTSYAWEIIVVDNGSIDGTHDLLCRLAMQPDKLPLIVVLEPTPGLSNARNAGLAVSRGEVICFTDDDCYPEPDYIDAWVSIFQSKGAPDYCCGRVELFDVTDVSETIKTDLNQQFIAPRTFIVPGSMHGASMAFTRSVVSRVGKFDSRLGAGTKLYSGEDLDYLQRSSLRGYTGLYDPRPVVWHHHGRKAPDIAALHRRYQIGKGGYFAMLIFTSPRATFGFILADFRSQPSLLLWCKRIWWRIHNQGATHTMYNIQGFFLFLLESGRLFLSRRLHQVT